MTYAGFLFVFLIIPICFMLLLVRRRLSRGRLVAIGALMLIALVYTTPWDNYLVANRIWWYAPGQVTGLTLGWVPIEEYAFFLLQPLATGLLLLALLPAGSPARLRSGDQATGRWFTWILALSWAIGVIMLLAGPQSTTYLGLELAWALPPLILQFLFGADLIWTSLRPAVSTLVLSTLYFAAADVIAIGAGIWTISPEHTLGINPQAALVLEEVVFFTLTNALVVGGLTLLWHPDSATRWQRLRTQWLTRILRRSSSDHAAHN